MSNDRTQNSANNRAKAVMPAAGQSQAIRNLEADIGICGCKRKTVLLCMGFAGLVIVSLFGIFSFFIIERAPASLKLTHWKCWEVGAVLWTTLFCFYYFEDMPASSNETFNKHVNGLVPFVTFLFLGGALWALYLDNFWAHAFTEFFMMIFLGFLDYLWSRALVGSLKSKMYLESLYIADMPFLIGVSFILAACWAGIENRDVFFSGAISFQLLASNVLFIITQAGCTRRIWFLTADAATKPH